MKHANSGGDEKKMEKSEEKAIFDKATEKLDPDKADYYRR